jgi:hypothetical protein
MSAKPPALTEQRKAIMQTLTNSNNYGVTLSEASQHLLRFHPFHTGTFSGAWEMTELSGEYQLAYIVRSYGVEIAVHPDEYGHANWIASDAYTHSVTTSKHANIVKKAWGL